MAWSRTWSRLASALTAFSTIALGCATSPDDGLVLETDGPTSARSDAITKGKPDTTHAAVMLQSCDTACICTGTLVQKDDSSGVGWIVTAAHCLPDPGKGPAPRFFVQGDTAATFAAGLASTIAPGATRYPVLDWVRHPDYKPASGSNPPTSDVGLVRILGVGPETPTLPLAGLIDGMAVNLPVIEVGYGSSGKLNDPQDLGVAGTRQRADVSIKSLDAKVISVDGNNANGSVNLGDDGGPTIANVGNVETVVAVHSARVNSGFGGARQDNTRITGVRLWLDAELTKPLSLGNCNTCLRIVTSGARACALPSRTCLDSVECNAFALCVEACADDDNAGPTKACRDSCAAAHPSAPANYEPSVRCGCQYCAVLCGTACDGLLPNTDPPDAGPADEADAGPSNPGPGRVTAPPADTGCSTTRESGRPASAGDGAGVVLLACVVLGTLERRRRRSVRRVAP